VGLLASAYLLAFVDRTVINLLVEPIKRDLQINDAQFGALQGLAFGVFYALAALPLGRLADSRSRRSLVAGGLAFFTAFSIFSGLARSYLVLFIMRIGVGAGEASILPSAYSMLSDLFPAHKLARALSVFTVGAFLGVGLSYIWGGGIIGWLDILGRIDLPLLGELRQWQLAFIIVALPGLLLVPLLFTLREPVRRGPSGDGGRVLPLGRVLQESWARRRILVPLFAGFGIIALSGHASGVWTIAVFLRVFSMPPQEIGPVYGLVYIAAAVPAALAAGWLCDHLTAAGTHDAPLKVAAFGFLGTGLFGAVAPLMPNPTLALALFAPAIAFQSMMYPLAATAIQLILPNRLRGQVSALYLIVVNVVGLGIGPMLIGLITDNYFSQAADVRYALSLVNAACAPLACACLLWGLAPFRGERARLLALAQG
jgi:MFS family permease